jgi:enoyl-CoA hydratase/carnithine racemase
MNDIDPLHVTRDGDVATLWLNRPEKRNAVTYEMWDMLPGMLAEVEASAPRVLLVRGAGGHFCAGADITGLGPSLADAGVPGGYREVNARAEAALMALALPVIAVIEGNCIGGGWQIASACDLRIAASSTILGITPARLGITYPPEAVRRTMAIVGASATKRLLYTAELIDADEALRLGFVDLLVADDALEERASAMAAAIAERSLLTQAATKMLVNAEILGSTELRRRHDELETASRDSVDLAEGLLAFAEKRPPAFTWRPA